MPAMIAGTSPDAAVLLHGLKTWPDGGSDVVEFVPQALEIEPEEARRIANCRRRSIEPARIYREEDHNARKNPWRRRSPHCRIARC